MRQQRELARQEADSRHEARTANGANNADLWEESSSMCISDMPTRLGLRRGWQVADPFQLRVCETARCGSDSARHAAFARAARPTRTPLSRWLAGRRSPYGGTRTDRIAGGAGRGEGDGRRPRRIARCANMCSAAARREW